MLNLDALEELLAKADEYEGGRRVVMADIVRQCLHNSAPAIIAELRELREGVIGGLSTENEGFRRRLAEAILWKAEYRRQVDEKDEQCAEAHALLFKAESDRDAALSEAKRLREANRWRPIAEAPKDNTGIEAIDSRTGFVRVVDYCKGYPPNWIPCWELQGASNECYPLGYFTHFRPIPDPPESA